MKLSWCYGDRRRKTGISRQGEQYFSAAVLILSIITGGPPRSRSGAPPWSRPRSRGPLPGEGLGAPLVQVKVQGAPRSRSGSRSVGPPVQVKVGPPRSRSGSSPGRPPCQGPKMWGAWVVRLLRSCRRTVLFNSFALLSFEKMAILEESMTGAVNMAL